jgi:hypothetical protein
MLTCIRCKETKLESEFFKEKGRASGYRGYCKSCCKDKKAETRQRKSKGEPPPQRKKTVRTTVSFCKTPQGVWSRHIKAKFGITIDQYNEMLDKQNGQCAICGTTTPDSKHGVFSIDHCHATGKIRGLLCKKCNSGIGMFKESARSLEAAVAYLQQYS